MPSNYSGNPSNVTTPLSRTVVDCVSGSGGFVQVETSVAHLFATNDIVTITGVVGTTEANVSDNPITVVDATHFLLDGVTFVNAYVSGGTVEDFALTPYFQVPNDGEYATTGSILAAIQALADRTQYLQANRPRLTVTEFTSSGTWTSPITGYAIFEGFGAGAGGGSGAKPTAGNDQWAGGGGGGAGATYQSVLVPVVRGVTYNIDIPAGGGGAAAITVAGTDGAKGSDGGNTIFRNGGTNIASLRGAGAGAGGVGRNNNTVEWFSPGGLTSSGITDILSAQGGYLTFDSSTTLIPLPVPAQGGGWGGMNFRFGSTPVNGTAGGYAAVAIDAASYAGGAGGTGGTDSGSERGGGAGGGGGAGPRGAGATGGTGGAGNAGVAGAGNNAAANSGAGGGGGGGGGGDSATPSNSGAGGNGGSGWARVIVVA